MSLKVANFELQKIQQNRQTQISKMSNQNTIRTSNQKIFFKTDNQLNYYQTMRQTNPFKPIPILIPVPIQVPIRNTNMHVNNSEGSVNIIESNMSKGSSRNYSQIQERMRSKYIGNIKAVREQLGQSDGQVVTSQQKAPPKIQQGQQVLYSPADILQFNDYGLSPKPTLQKVQPEQRIIIQKTLTKPKFAFKSKPKNHIDNINQDTINTNDGVISFDSSSITEDKLQNKQLNMSKSASNFSQILKINQDKVAMRHVKYGELEGYMLSKIDKKQENITKKLQQLKKGNEAYDTKIKQKQRQIEMIKKKLQKQKKQLNTYQSKMIQAYDNISQAPDSLLLSSRNYETSDEKFQQRIKNKRKIFCQFQGFGRKLCKQIIYAKCMILENDLLQIGYDNSKKGSFQMFFTNKENFQELCVQIQGVTENGYVIQKEEKQMRVKNIPAGKKIKRKINVEYGGNSGKVGLMSVRVNMQLNKNTQFTENIVLPFSIYRNFLTEVSQKQKPNPTILTVPNDSYPIVSQWQNCCDQLQKNPKSYLQTLFKTGTWIQQNIFHIDLLYKDTVIKSMNILLNCRNFAIQMMDQRYLDAVVTVGNFLARAKDKDGSRNYSRVH